MQIKFKLVIGLGNPRDRYKSTYHNAGFLAIDYWKSDPALTVKNYLKSSVYMNQSGQFVKKELQKKGAKPEELLIVHDDSDIPLGEYKLDFNRGSAGHKGVQSVIEALKTKEFWRLRIGIREDGGLPPQAEDERIKAEDIVLRKITKKNMEKLERVFGEAAESILASERKNLVLLPRRSSR